MEAKYVTAVYAVCFLGPCRAVFYGKFWSLGLQMEVTYFSYWYTQLAQEGNLRGKFGSLWLGVKCLTAVCTSLTQGGKIRGKCESLFKESQLQQGDDCTLQK